MSRLKRPDPKIEAKPCINNRSKSPVQYMLVAGRGRGAGWGRPRVLWRCSAAAYVGAGCLQEEIDKRLLRSGGRAERARFMEEGRQ